MRATIQAQLHKEERRMPRASSCPQGLEKGGAKERILVTSLD